MHVLALFGVWRDGDIRKGTLAVLDSIRYTPPAFLRSLKKRSGLAAKSGKDGLTAPSGGIEEADLLWLIAQRGMTSHTGVVAGTLPRLAFAVGIPPARLRMALPEEFVPFLMDGSPDGLLSPEPEPALRPEEVLLGEPGVAHAVRQIVGHSAGFDDAPGEAQARRRARREARMEAYERRKAEKAQRREEEERRAEAAASAPPAEEMRQVGPPAAPQWRDELDAVSGALHRQLQRDLVELVHAPPPRLVHAGAKPRWTNSITKEQRVGRPWLPVPQEPRSPTLSPIRSSVAGGQRTATTPGSRYASSPGTVASTPGPGPRASAPRPKVASPRSAVDGDYDPGSGGITPSVVFSTALVLSFMQHSQLLPGPEIDERRAAAGARFAAYPGCLPPCAASFDDLVDMLLSFWLSTNMAEAGNWVEKAQLWRIVLLAQHMRVRGRAPPPPPPPAKGEPAALPERSAKVYVRGARWEMSASLAVALCAHREGSACPLEFTPAAALRSAKRPEGVSDTAWTTALVAAKLATLDYSWLVTGLKEVAHQGMAPMTLMDAAYAWLAAVARPACGVTALVKAAEEQVKAWDESEEARCKVLRKAHGTPRFYAWRSLSSMLGSMAQMLWTLRTQHETFSLLLDPFVAELRYFQKAIVLCTSVIALLMVQIWFFYTRANNCCQEIRLSYGCVADTTVDCAIPGTASGGGQIGGGEADCTVLLAYAPSDWVCQAFPMPSSMRDSILVTLISVACLPPLKTWMEFLFVHQNERHTSAAVGRRWLSSSPGWFLKLIGGAPGWRYAERRVGLAELQVATSDSLQELMLDKLDAQFIKATSMCSFKKKAPPAPRKHIDTSDLTADSGAAKNAASGFDSGDDDAADVEKGGKPSLSRAMRSVPHGLVFAYFVWIVMVWFIFACPCPLWILQLVCVLTRASYSLRFRRWRAHRQPVGADGGTELHHHLGHLIRAGPGQVHAAADLRGAGHAGAGAAAEPVHPQRCRVVGAAPGLPLHPRRAGAAGGGVRRRARQRLRKVHVAQLGLVVGVPDGACWWLYRFRWCQ
jgi:hypothetical protein